MRFFNTEFTVTKRALRIAWAFVVLLAVVLLVWLVLAVVSLSDDNRHSQAVNAAQDSALAEANRRLTEAGEQPVPTPEAGPQGTQGEPGPAPTAEQIMAAVSSYCSSGACEGKQPTRPQVASAVASYCDGSRCTGPRGQQGQPGKSITGAPGSTGATGPQGPGPTVAQMAAAVADYCAGGRCTGPAGSNGTDGKDGQSAFPFTFRFTVQTNPVQSTTYTVTCQVDGCTVTES